MKCMRALVFMATLLTMGLLSGCAPEIGAHIMASPEALDFGLDKDEITLRVYKTHTGTVMEPLVATAGEVWIQPENCLEVADDCVSGGPADAVRVRVRIDRNSLDYGLNAGTLRLRAGGVSTLSVPVLAEERVSADFSADVRTTPVGRVIAFRDMSRFDEKAGAITRYSWSFGDGATSEDANPLHSYQAPGIYDVSLTIETDDGVTRTRTKHAFITVGTASGDVDFVASKTSVEVGETIAFTDLTAVGSAAVQSRLWDFGDGTTSSEAAPVYAYTASGHYSVTLTLTTSGGVLTGIRENYIVVRSTGAPQARLAFDSAGGATPFAQEPIRFYDRSIEGSSAIVEWAWDFGDDMVSNEPRPVHEYQESGVYTVTLTVRNGHGVSETSNTVTVVYRPPTARFSAHPRVQYAGYSISFSDDSDPGFADVGAWRWLFGDGGESRMQNPVYSYAEPGVYTVSLRVTGSDPDSRRDELVEEEFITVVAPPEPAFTWNPSLVSAMVPVEFDARATLIGGETITAYQWDFGDGTSGAGERVTHTYYAYGRIPVTLTVTTDAGEVSMTREVVVNRPPLIEFDAEPREGYVNAPIRFTLADQPDSARPITSYFWEFGDGNVSFDSSPTHHYDSVGLFTVRLTARYRHSEAGPDTNDLIITGEQLDFVSIVEVALPTANIETDKDWAYVGDPVEFRILNPQSPQSPITGYIWDFGDGTIRELTVAETVTHTYQTAGNYSASLTIVVDGLPEQYRYTVIELGYPLVITTPSTLEEYIDIDDGCYSYSAPVTQNIIWEGQHVATAHYIYSLTSQCWNPDGAVRNEYVPWTHSMVIVEPLFKVTDTAMLYIDGGSRGSTIRLDDALWQVAVLTGSSVVHLKNVPSQPIVFRDEVIPNRQQDNETGADLVLRRRSEDAAIAYSYKRYLESYRATGGNPAPEWPLLFPMTKAAVKAMDVAQELLPNVDDFVVWGGSKRGWTTWLTGAVDRRVKAIAPVVINVLKMPEHLQHHRNIYGYWAPAIYDYAQAGVFDQLLPGEADGRVTPEAQSLLEQVDPYEYALRRRYPMPKFMMNATGDEFFVPDASQMYFDQLQGERHLCYVPNVGHGMGDGLQDGPGLTNPATPPGMFLAWYMAVTQNKARAEFVQTLEQDGAIRVRITSGHAPSSVRLWKATARGNRDFRNYVLGQAWTSSPLSPQQDGTYLAQPPATPAGDYTAYFIQLEFPNSAQFPDSLRPALQMLGYTVPNQVYTTSVRVTPEEYPVFEGYVANDERPDAVYFSKEKMPVITAYGSSHQMGHDYGRLLADEIAAFIPNFLATYLAETGNTTDFLDASWAVDSATMDRRILEEIEGIAAALNGRVTLQQLQWAHSAAMRERIGTWTTSSVLAYRDMLVDADFGHGVTINGPLHRNLHQYQCAVFYIPDQGAPHVVITYAGLAFGRVGVNLGGISATEVPDPTLVEDFNPARRNALPVLRSLLYDSMSLRDAVGIVKANPPRRTTTFILGDSRNERRGALVKMSSAGVVSERYDLESSLRRPGIVYAARPALQNPLRARIGQVINSLSSLDILAIATEPPFAEPDRNLLNVACDLYLNLVVRRAEGNAPAYLDEYNAFNVQLLLP